MGNKNVLAIFLSGAILVMGLAFAIHLFILSRIGLPLFDNMILLCYVVNLALAFIIFFALYRLRYKLSSQIGFLFMGGSLLKFLVFFLVFYPAYLADGDMSRPEFAAFFIPYVISLVWETVWVARILRNMENEKS
ncbi:DUF6168 family protein [Zeaxanthinibacter enoshimensis]|uniref:DUF6168 family protein n=1 Tax=Zeaxanthinibacter enoshimensis TaxID=392009 RepID=UPI003568BA81